MHGLWTIPTVNMTYTRSENYTNMVVGKNEIQIFKVVIIVLLFLSSQVHIPCLFGKVVCPNMLKCQMNIK